jgi:MscS family membrane protein
VIVPTLARQNRCVNVYRTGVRNTLAAAAIFAAYNTAGAAALQLQLHRDSTRSDSSRAETRVEPASPRAALEQFLTLARTGEYVQASAYLDYQDAAGSEGQMARRLKAVLDRHLWVDLEQLSPVAVGDTTDSLPRDREQIGTVTAPNRLPVPIQLARNAPGADVPWRFTRATLERIPALYDALEDRWMLEHMPPLLLRPGPLELLLWQWAALPLLFALAALIGKFGSRMVGAAATRIVGRTHSNLDDAVLARLGAPLWAALTLVVAALLLPWLSLYRPAAQTMYRVLGAGLFLVFFWALWRVVDIVLVVLAASRWARASASSRALLPLAGRITKAIIFSLAAVAVLSMAGFPVASLIAGLGIGGLALALAAQKTVENLFAAFSIGVDQPIREGDLVKVEEFVGTVEQIGLRSTRFRTLDRTIITIPNGRLAEMRLESYTARDRMRLATTIGLEYRTTAAQMRDVLAGFERVLCEHPKIWSDTVVVRFSAFGPSSLDIEIMAWFQTDDSDEFQLIRQEVLLQFMEVIEQVGASFAFPTQTLHIASLPLPEGGRALPAPRLVPHGTASDDGEPNLLS